MSITGSRLRTEDFSAVWSEDARTRGADARRTIDMWASVRRGEEQNIFPFQEDADAMFNSVSIYELAVLKQFAEPLLFQIDKGEPEYYEAKRLLKFLEYFLGVTSESLPNNSLCRNLWVEAASTCKLFRVAQFC